MIEWLNALLEVLFIHEWDIHVMNLPLFMNKHIYLNDLRKNTRRIICPVQLEAYNVDMFYTTLSL